jgi:hypothetical protein
VLLCALLFAVGCNSTGEKSAWDAALKDLRGDNMKMRYGANPETKGVWE